MAVSVGELQALLTLKDQMSPALKALNGNLAATSNSFKSLETSLKSAGSSMQTLGSSLLPITAAITAAGAASVIFAAKFEASMVRLVSLAGVSQSELEGVKEHILALAPAVGIGPQALAEAMTKISSTTSDTAVALSILDTAAKGSAAGMGTALDVAGALTAIINSYGAENITAARAADILTQTVKEGGAEAKELAPTLAMVVPIAAQLGVSFEEVGANIATVTKLGVPAAEAVTQLSSVFSALMKPTAEGEKALASIGMSYESLRKSVADAGLAETLLKLQDAFKGNAEGLTDVFGRIEAVRNIMSVGGAQAETYRAVLEKVSQSAGSLDEAFKAMEGTSAHTWDQLTAQISVLAIKLGDELAPNLLAIVKAGEPLIEWVVQAVEWFAKLPQPVQMAAMAVAAMAAALGPLLIVLGTMASALGALIPLIAPVGVALGIVGTAVSTLAGILAPFLVMFLQVAAAFAAGWAVGTLIRDITGLGAALDGLADKWSGLTEMEAGQGDFEKKIAEMTKGQAAMRAAALAPAQGADLNKALGAALATIPKVTAGVNGLSVAQNAAAEAAKQHADAIQTLASSLSGADLAKQAQDMVSALSGVTLDDSGLERAHAQIQTLITGGLKELPPALQEVESAWFAMTVAAQEANKVTSSGTMFGSDFFGEMADAAMQMDEVSKALDQTALDLQEYNEAMVEVMVAMGAFVGISEEVVRAMAGMPEGVEGLENVATDAEKAADGVQKLADAWREAGSAMLEFGSQLGGVFGSLVSGLGMAAQAWGDYTEAAAAAKASGEKGAGAAAVAGLGVNLLGAAASASGASMDSASGGSRALAGAAGGAKIGMTVGSILGPMGAVIGAAAGAIIGGVVGFLKKPSWVKVGKEAGEILGVEVSKELAKAIEETSKSLDLSVADATLLHISDAITETGASAASMGQPIMDLMSGIAAGTIPAVEGMEELENVFSIVRDQATGVGDAMTVAMLKAAQAAGTMTDGMKAFVSEQNNLMAEGAADIAAAMENIEKVGGPVGERAAMFFAMGFEGAIAEQGLLGAVDSLGEQAISLFKKLNDAGNKAGASLIGPFASLAKKLDGNSPASKALRGQIDLLTGMGKVFEGAANQGLVTAEVANAFGSQLTDSFNALVKGGIDAKTAMQAIKPELDKAVSTAAQLGVPLDANSQALKDQAIAMGFAFPTEPIVQLVDLMKTLVEGMGFALPASAQAAGAAITTSITGASTAAGSAFSSSMGTISSSAAGAASSASSSLSGIGQAAEASSSTLISAFTGVGEEITGSITQGTDAIASQLTSAFGLGMDEAAQLAAMIQALGNQSITIPVIFDQQGGFAIPGGDTGFQDIPKFQHGSDGFKDFGAGTQAILHHVEGVFTPAQIKEMLREAATAGASMRIGEQNGDVAKLIASAEVMAKSFKFQDEIHRARIQSDATAAVIKARLRNMYSDGDSGQRERGIQSSDLKALLEAVVGRGGGDGGHATINVYTLPHQDPRQIAEEANRLVRLNKRSRLTQAGKGYR